MANKPKPKPTLGLCNAHGEPATIHGPFGSWCATKCVKEFEKSYAKTVTQFDEVLSDKEKRDAEAWAAHLDKIELKEEQEEFTAKEWVANYLGKTPEAGYDYAPLSADVLKNTNPELADKIRTYYNREIAERVEKRLKDNAERFTQLQNDLDGLKTHYQTMERAEQEALDKKTKEARDEMMQLNDQLRAARAELDSLGGEIRQRVTQQKMSKGLADVFKGRK